MKLIAFKFVILIMLTSCVNEKVFVKKSLELPPVKMPFKIISSKTYNYKITITPLIEPKSNNLYIPDSIKDAVNQIKPMLSEEDYNLLMKSYFLKLDLEETNYVEELKRRLSDYLFYSWVLHESPLSEKLRCIGAFEGSVSFLFYMESVSFAIENDIKIEMDTDYNEFWQNVKSCEGD